MRIITDLHIHSGYARACSKLLTLENIDVWCQKKGIGLVGVADFTHPERFKEIKNNLVEVGQSGLYKFSGAQASTLFIMSTELSLIYRHRDKTRRIHMCVFLSNLEAVDRFNQALTAAGGKLAADGRPILGMSCKQILTIIKEVDEQGFVVPAHAWTPWFAIFGSKSGYDSLEECFEELTPEVKAIETGLSSSPTMNRRLSSLDKINLISNSDSHSLANIGRNANVFDLAAFSYEEIRQGIQDMNSGKLVETLEFYPEEGIYHYDGHRACGICFSPEQTKKHKGICPKCGKPLTIGVMNRVEELADRLEKDIHSQTKFTTVIPLQDVIAESLGVNKHSKRVQSIYEEMVARGQSEFNVLLNLNEKELCLIGAPRIAEAILRVRRGQVKLVPGFDGQYGKIEIFSEKEREKQGKLL